MLKPTFNVTRWSLDLFVILTLIQVEKRGSEPFRLPGCSCHDIYLPLLSRNIFCYTLFPLQFRTGL
ncbi:hypothetical protein IF2G_03051 [Cordyceps javanica]|nr:hypothetical protein IF2G_03051 [Cordyceps javanica]